MEISPTHLEAELPFALIPTDMNARLAISAVTHTHQVGRPFTAIDQGGESEFIERWMGWFSDAILGQLGRPSYMPEGNPRGSWRLQ